MLQWEGKDRVQNLQAQIQPVKGDGMLVNRLFRLSSIVAILVLAACTSRVPATHVPISTSVPPASIKETTAVAALPFEHTACAEGVDLRGQNIPFYHILNPNDQV